AIALAQSCRSMIRSRSRERSQSLRVVARGSGSRPSRVADAYDFRDEGRALLALDLHRDLVGQSYAVAFDGLDLGDLEPQAHACAGGHGGGEADSVGPVVHPVLHLVHLHERGRQTRHQRQRQIAVGDGLAPRHLASGALRVDVNPLVITGGISELVDHRLVDGHPLRRAQLLADVGHQIVRRRDGQRSGHVDRAPPWLHMIDSSPLNLPREETSMQFGLFMMPLHPPERSFVDSYERDLAQIVLADRLGYHEVWIGEHLTERWENAPAPELLIAQALLKTERIVLAT